MITPLLRASVILIAVAAVIDPVLTRDRSVAPIVEITVAPGAEALGRNVAAFLQPRFEVVPAPVARPAARVVVGDLPTRLSGAAAVPGFVVTFDPASSRPFVAAVRTPVRAPLDARIPVDVTVRGAAGSAVEVELTVDGLPVDQVTLPAADASSLRPALLSFLPSRPGPHHLRVTARAVGGDAIADRWADTLVTVTDEPWRALVYDPRPAWSSTFVRRVLDRDERFEVVARVAAGPNASVATEPTTPGLGAVPALMGFDVLVVGAPDALGADEIEVVRQFMRQRAGSVILLIDADPGAAAQLAGVSDWDESLTTTPVSLAAAGDDTGLLATEVVVPNPPPPGARALASVDDSGVGAPVVWQRPVGAGRLVISGALDAWRFRGSAGARFDDFWRAVVAEAASAAPRAIELRVEPRVVRPGEAVRVGVDVRDVVLATEPAAEISIRASLAGGEGAVPVRLWPAAKGRFLGELPAPESPGSYRLLVETADGERAAADLIVAADAARATPTDVGLLENWAAAHGGIVVPETHLDDLVTALDGAVTLASSPFRWYPMRSAWWMLPFAVMLGAEWWIRRRRGDR